MPSASPLSNSFKLPSNSFGLKPVWAMRLLSILALLSLILAQTLFHSSPMRDACLGFGTGILFVAVALSFWIRNATYRNQPSSCDIEDLSITK